MNIYIYYIIRPWIFVQVMNEMVYKLVFHCENEVISFDFDNEYYGGTSVDTWRNNNVIITSKRRCNVAICGDWWNLRTKEGTVTRKKLFDDVIKETKMSWT